MKQKEDKNKINYLNMKTKQVMIRQMGDFSVLQRTDNRMFNATELLEQWNESNPNNQRRLDKFWDSTHLPELMEEIIRNEYPTHPNFEDVSIDSTSPNLGELKPSKKGRKKADSTSLKIGDVKNNFNTPKIGELKKILCKTSKARSDRGGGTWMHPMLFIKFAMYLNPRFEYQVLKFVQDELIDVRHEAGDHCNAMKKAIAGIITDPTKQFPHIMKALNLIVFGVNDKDLRQTGTSEQLKELATLESFIGDSVACGLIQSFDHLIAVLRNKYRLKHETIN